jgi:primase-polymerase (primpol)-like protein
MRFAGRVRMKTVRLGVGICGVAIAVGAAWGATPRSKSLAQFDAGYAQCEKKHPQMRGQGDIAYANLYRLKLDDTLRATLDTSRSSTLYKTERRRATQKLAKSMAASDVAERLELQCQALQREIAKNPGDAKR